MVQWYCPDCFAEVEPQTAHCPRCGADLADPARDFEEQLIRALAHPLPDRRLFRTAVPRLIGIVEEADDPYLVAEAIVALARIGDPAGLAVVDRISRQGPAVGRVAARTALHERRPPPSGSPRPVEDGG